MTVIEQTTVVTPNGNVVVDHPDLRPGDKVKVLVMVPASEIERSSGRLKADWTGALADLQGEFTSVKLQHQATFWRGE